MDLSLKQQLLDVPELRRRLRQLRWFTRAFQENAELIATHLDLHFTISDRRLQQAFFHWVTAITPIEQDPTFDKADRIVFMGGLALRELWRARPAALIGDARPEQAGDDVTAQIAHSWPEGFLYTNFCICSIAAVHEQEFGEPRRLHDAAFDLRTWWSYRENVSEDPGISIAFLDRFLGIEPNWRFPGDPRRRVHVRRPLGAGPRSVDADRDEPMPARSHI